MTTIIIAWVALDGARDTGELYRFDGINYKKRLETCPKGHAVVWLNQGEQKDVEKAKAYARTQEAKEDREIVRVYQYPENETDPLSQAKDMVMAEYQS